MLCSKFELIPTNIFRVMSILKNEPIKIASSLFTTAELQALAEIVGPYGIQYMGDRLMEQVSAQVKEIKKLVEQNQDTLLALHTNRDKPDIFNDLFRKLRSEYPYCTVLVHTEL